MGQQWDGQTPDSLPRDVLIPDRRTAEGLVGRILSDHRLPLLYACGCMTAGAVRPSASDLLLFRWHVVMLRGSPARVWSELPTLLTEVPLSAASNEISNSKQSAPELS